MPSGPMAAVAALAVLLLVYALLSRRLSTTVVSAAMFFVVGGMAIGPEGLGLLDESVTSATVEVLAEGTLALVLFADASRIRLGALRKEASWPIRLLGIGLPLTIVAGTGAAMLLLPELLLAEALVLAVILAPTDAALGLAVVSDTRLPGRIRQALNVESGLNDGICVPLLVIALAWADAESRALTAAESLRVTAEAIGYGISFGLAVGAVAAFALRLALRQGWSGGGWEQVVPLTAAAAAFALADWAGGSGFIAAFTGGLVFGTLVRQHEQVGRLLEEVGGVTNALTFTVLGALLVVPALSDLDPAIFLYAVVSLTIVRMLPVALAMWGTGAKGRSVGFMGWFGPRGLASLVFLVSVIDADGLPHQSVLVTAGVVTVLLSVFAHGVTAVPLTNRYVMWFAGQRTVPDVESAEVHEHRWRGQMVAERRSVIP
jgi:NhaP-type Na+/H+ or K+/H+ antiporter